MNRGMSSPTVALAMYRIDRKGPTKWKGYHITRRKTPAHSHIFGVITDDILNRRLSDCACLWIKPVQGVCEDTIDEQTYRRIKQNEG